MATVPKMRTFQPKQQPTVDLWNTTFPIDVLWGIYARQSTQAQLIKHPESTEMQTDDLIAWLAERGVRDGHWRLFDADLGKSGTLRIDQRTGLQELVALIQADSIKAVLVYRVSRLFRDETGVQYNTFANICKEHNCIVVTADGMFFNFNNPMHLKMFRYLAEQAAEYLPQQMKMLYEARVRKARRGLFVGFGPKPFGYIVDYDPHSPMYKKYAVYTSHATIVVYIFERFYALEGDFTALCKELEEIPALFPDFAEWVDIRNLPKKSRKKVPGGYHISDTGLELLLTNPAYLGWWIVQGDIISRENHAPIIDKGHEYLFWYAFERLAAYTTEGKKNEQKQHVLHRRFYHKHTSVQVLLNKKKLISPQGVVSVQPSRYGFAYTITPQEYHVLRLKLCAIHADRIDAEFTRCFFRHLDETHDFDEYRKWVEEEAAKHQSQLTTLLSQLTEIEAQQEAILDEKLSLRQQINGKIKKALAENPDTDVAALKQRLEDEVAGDMERLRKRAANLDNLTLQLKEQIEALERNQQLQTARKFVDFHTEVAKLRREWHTKPLAVRAEFVNLFITQVAFTVVAPHWVKLEMYWRHPLWGIDTLYLYRNKGMHPEWTEAEREIVKALYPSAPREEILQLLPTKTWRSIRSEALRLGVTRVVAKEKGTVLSTLTWLDIEFMRQEGFSDLNTKYVSSSQ